jgi:murein L,D-transpeptidase YcbB/YkuD
LDPQVTPERWIVTELERRIADRQEDQNFGCRSEMLCGISELPVFYRRRNYRPAWIRADGYLPIIDQLNGAIRRASRVGLDPSSYHLSAIEGLIIHIADQKLAEIEPDQQSLIDLELLSTDSYLMLASHLAGGRVNPETIHTEWMVTQPEFDLAAALQKALDRNNLQDALTDLQPSHPGYGALAAMLERYRLLDLRLSRAPLPSGPSLQAGDYDLRVSLLRTRLIDLGDLDVTLEEAPYRFDQRVEEAVKRFQRRHGLEDDGIVGPATLSELNVPLEQRIRQIELNLERWRWIPHELGRRYILVNIAGYQLYAVENQHRRLEMRVVVGRNYRRTPVFSEKMTYLVLNPDWNVPKSIAVKDILPKVKEDPSYLQRLGFKVYDSWQDDAAEIDPAAIDWSSISSRNFRFRLVQAPGPQNALGRIKFMLPNKYAVYLHDTPSQQLFQQARRGFSSGCIRVENPFRLAAYVLQGQEDWTEEKLEAAVKSGKKRIIGLQGPVPVHLLYWTAWVDDEGELNFRKDIYDRDEPLDRALKEKPPRF